MKRIIYSFVSLLFTIAVLITVSYAWFTNSEFVEPEISGYSVAAYFGGGDGSAEHPFQIKSQRHLYNLAWLQYLGKFNQPGSGNTPNKNNTTTLTSYCFQLDNDIPMSDDWKLPPIGTTKYPFIGTLNGQGYKISGLTTTNNFSDFGLKHPGSVVGVATDGKDLFADAEIIGFIGSIGTISGMEYDGYTISSTTNGLYNLKLQETTVKTTTHETLCGIVAGYINATVSNVGVVKGSLDIGFGTAINNQDSVSSYTVAGYATEDYLTKVSNNKTIVMNPTTMDPENYIFESQGNSNDWGGSIDMNSLYKRINSKISSTRLNSYVTNEIRYYNNNVWDKNKDSVTVSASPSSDHYYNINKDGSGSYLTQKSAPYNGYDYLTALYKSVIYVNKKNDVDSGFTIKSLNGNYLNFTSTRSSNNSLVFNGSLTSSDDENKATVWVPETRGSGVGLYTYNSDDGQKYYLNATTSGISTSIESNTTWKYDNEVDTYYFENGNNKYYLKYINGWTVSNKVSYFITDDKGNYLTRNGSYVKNGNETEATRWCFSVDGSNPSGLIYDEQDTTGYLYINNNTLRVGNNTNTTWINNGVNLQSNSKKYLKYENGWIVYTPTKYLINYDDSYLSVGSNGELISAVFDDDPLLWSFSDISDQPKGIVSIEIDDTTYYLSYDNGLILSTTIQTNWLNDGDGLYILDGTTKKYLQYNNSLWQVDVPAQKLFGYNVSYNGETLSYQGNTTLMVDSQNRVYFIYNNQNYYLYINATLGWSGYNYALGVTTSQNESYYFKKNGTQILASDIPSGWFGTTTRYLTVDNSGNPALSSSAVNLNIKDLYTDDIENTPVGKLEYINRNVKSKVTKAKNCIQRIDSVINIYERKNPVTEPSVYNYIPLNTNPDNTVKDSNTGYIMSGGHSTSSGGLTAVDIRVAGEATSYNIKGRLTLSLENDGTFKSNSVYTYDGTLHTINDSTNTYKKYTASKTALQKTLQSITKTSNSSKVVSGIHFITSSISMDHMITAPKVVINGNPYEDYQMPENSIDFQLKQKGYINFFAGLYYPGNTSFFSLHKIERDGNQNITSINHIVEIWKKNDNTGDYLYRYKSNTNTYSWSDSNINSSITNPSGYTRVFDCSWIESPNVTSWDGQNDGGGYDNNGYYLKKLFYFEIPVNKGEYALGSVDGRDGGYLLYLDIGANANQIDRTEIRQKVEVSKYDYAFPTGIAIIMDGTSVDEIDAALSAVVRVVDSTGKITLERTATNTITATGSIPTAVNLTSTYIPRGVTLNDVSTAMTASAVKTTSSICSQIQYIDYSSNENKTYETNLIREKTTVTDIDDNVLSTSTSPTSLSIYDITDGRTCIFDTRDSSIGGTDPTSTDLAWNLNGVYTDSTGAKKNITYKLNGTQPLFNGEDSSMKTKREQELVELNSVFDAIAAYNLESILVYDYDSSVTATNTYDALILSSRDTSITDGLFFKFDGDNITITTNNTGGITVHITTNNGTYTFNINGTRRQGTIDFTVVQS